MKSHLHMSLLSLLVFVVLALLPRPATSQSAAGAPGPQSSRTLDEFLSPAELANEFRLQPGLTADLNQPPPLTPLEVLNKYGVDVFAEFPVVIVINTSARGLTGQRLTLYHNRQLVGVFKTSTGRDQKEVPPQGAPYFSSTPTGWFSPTWFERNYFSKTWQAPMDFAIFFNGGIAIHATTPEHYAELGTKASGGCVRLTHTHAEQVWNLAYTEPPRLVPIFRVNGEIALDRQGHVLRHRGSGVLILVVNMRD